MKINISEQASAIWSRITKDAKEEEEELKFELEIHKRLLSFFHVGDYYYYIFNIKTSALEFISNDVTRVLGYELEEIDLPFFLSKIHEEDQPWFLNFENKAGEFFSTLSSSQIPNYKIRYDYRVRKKDGNYLRILHQVVTIQIDNNNNVLRTFGVHTDISHLKMEGVPVLSFIGLNGEPSYINVAVENLYSTNKILLTTRERDVLKLIIEGKTSEEISTAMFISKHTVDSHRKNLLQKTNCTNTSKLIAEAIKNGWV